MDEYYRLLQSLPPALRAPLEKLDIHYAPYVQEIRLRLGQPVLFTMQGRLCPAAKFLPGARLPTVLDAEALRDCFLQLCRRSVYAYEEMCIRDRLQAATQSLALRRQEGGRCQLQNAFHQLHRQPQEVLHLLLRTDCCCARVLCRVRRQDGDVYKRQVQGRAFWTSPAALPLAA